MMQWAFTALYPGRANATWVQDLSSHSERFTGSACMRECQNVTTFTLRQNPGESIWNRMPDENRVFCYFHSRKDHGHKLRRVRGDKAITVSSKAEKRPCVFVASPAWIASTGVVVFSSSRATLTPTKTSHPHFYVRFTLLSSVLSFSFVVNRVTTESASHTHHAHTCMSHKVFIELASFWN